MKMQPEHYATLKAACAAVLAPMPDARARYANKGLSETRFVWDVLHATKLNICGSQRQGCELPLYTYLNDSHIQTALVKICREVQP